MSLGPSPRKLQRRKGISLLGSGCLRIFIIPHTLVGIGILLVFLGKLALGTVGTKTEANIVAKTISHSKKSSRRSHSNTSYNVKFAFVHDRQSYEGQSNVGETTYGSLPEQGRIPIVYLPIAPKFFADYQDPESAFPSNTWPMLGFALFWNAIVGVFFYVAYIGPWREKQLIVQGGEADGKVLSKSFTRGYKGGTRYEITYSYTVLGATYKGSASVNAALYEATPEGAPLSVAYDLAKPQRSMAVELSDWEVVR
jgi:hypothetical protein